MKTAIVTGAGTGLGAELAKLYAKEGFFVYLIGRTKSSLDTVCEEIKTENTGSAAAVSLDIRDMTAIENFVKSIPQDHDVTLLINNAGAGRFGPFLESKEEDLTLLFETNTFGTIYMTKAILPIMQKNNKGTILNIISTAGLRGKKNESLYAASKFAVRGFTESLKKELEETDLRIIPAYMGGMDTPFWDTNDHISDKSRLRSPSEVAQLIYEQSQVTDEIVIESKK
ncbi:SDR family NAD(P)-dependent oxidoreductase [Heyndrickxia acidicola]|uniref:SDR family NAD(P)-dependent oxidoreductase n=1 Tax=Heyndrickxia acidicola TaxID=209389 RepID=A0ABU6MLY1_9BACI|nr:SDR family oxidoreductase [Heyndrickxia acidicola]MED1204981.1 SDR family NAD(P)-dependent oxidoreductase [Heyndrickxia acidicola]